MKPFVLSLVLALTGLGFLVAADLTVALPQDVITDYNTFVAAHGADVQAIKDFKGPGSRRDVVEAVLFVQALRLGGLEVSVKFAPIDSYSRILEQIRSGAVAASANPVWSNDIAGDLDVVEASPAVVEDGEFVVGMYTVPTNDKALKTGAAGVGVLTAVSNKAWTKDWEALTSLKLKTVDSVATWATMIKLVAAGRNDFLLAPFSPKDDLSFDADGQKFVPIPNLKVKFAGTRVFIAKKGSDQAKALAKGIADLKKRGIVARAYTDAGFFNPKVAGWVLLNR